MGNRSRVWAALLLVSLYWVGWVAAYSRGAPDSACSALTPGHGGASQSSSSPFSLTPSSVSVDPGQRMLVTLESTTGVDRFMGFIVQARDAETDQVVGTFFTTDHKYLTCGPGFNNAVTHGGGSQKAKVVLEWEPKSDFQGDIVFKGSFVKDYSTYWVGVTSEKVTVVKREAPAPAPETSPATIPQTPATTATTSTSTSTTTTTTTAATTTITTAAPAAPSADPSSVSSNTGSAPASANLGDLVITEIDAPQVDAVDNDISSTSDGAADVLQPTPPPVAPSSSTSFSAPPPPPPPPVSTDGSSSSTISDDSIISTESNAEEVVTEAAVSRTPGTTASAGPGGKRDSTTRRKGLLGRLRPRPTTAPPITTTTTTTKRPFSGVSSAPIANSISSAMDSIYLGCESTKGCFGFPDNCIKKENCKFLMTYAKSPSEGGYRFEISGDVDGPSGYVAGGLSRDGTMGDDSVMICRTEDGITDVVMGWNQGKSNNILADSNLGISNEQTAFVDGRVYCSFVRDVETEIFANVFNLDTDKYNLMVAAGPVSSGGSSITWHSGGKVVSGGQINLGEFASVEPKDELFKILHACFMIGAWVCAASIGILMARYFKQTWLRSACCKIDQWFHWHRFFMGLTWLLTMVGFGCIVWYLQGISTIPPGDNPHVILGFISTGLCFIQPFMALCRCSPSHRRRPIFNWLHWFVGNSAQIVGITAIFFGLQLWKAPTWTMWLLIIFVAFHCLVHLILSIGQCVSDSKAEHSSNIFPMKDMNGSRSPLHPVDKKEDAPGTTFRKTMLSFYLIVNILITAALILIIYPGVAFLKENKVIFWE